MLLKTFGTVSNVRVHKLVSEPRGRRILEANRSQWLPAVSVPIVACQSMWWGASADYISGSIPCI